jgi:hypothetical protein
VQAEALASQPGFARVTGLAHEGAAVGVMNEGTFSGIITRSSETDCGRSCAFEAVIEAELGEEVRVWQFFETGNPEHVFVE